MNVTVRFARHDEADDVARFLHQHWSANHILSRHRGLLDFQHRGRDGYHLVIARREGDPDLLALLGVIRNAQYDSALADRDTLWLTTWMTRPDVRIAGLGLRLHRFLTTTLPHHGMGTVGNNAAAEAIYRALRFETGTLTQYYLFRRDRHDGDAPLQLATAQGEARRPHPDVQQLAAPARLRRLDADDLVTLDPLPLGTRGERPPTKTARYFAGRYLRHPIFAYEVLGVERDGDIDALLAVRPATNEGPEGRATALRMVDYLGDDTGLRGTHDAFQALLERHDAEYADLFNHGLPARAFSVAGFRRLDPAGETIIPNFFEPFDAQNVILRWAFHGDAAPVLFKADADQDRPNQLPDSVSPNEPSP